MSYKIKIHATYFPSRRIVKLKVIGAQCLMTNWAVINERRLIYNFISCFESPFKCVIKGKVWDQIYEYVVFDISYLKWKVGYCWNIKAELLPNCWFIWKCQVCNIDPIEIVATIEWSCYKLSHLAFGNNFILVDLNSRIMCIQLETYGRNDAN